MSRSSLDIANGQLSAARPLEAKHERVNLRPPVMMTFGVAAHQLLEFFQRRIDVQCTTGQVRYLNPNLTDKLVELALIYLCWRGFIEIVSTAPWGYRLVERERIDLVRAAQASVVAQRLKQVAPAGLIPGSPEPLTSRHECRQPVAASSAAAAAADEGAAVRSGREASAAMDALARLLSAGLRDSIVIKAKMGEAGFTSRQVRLARERLSLIVSRSGSGRSMRSNWSLPDGHTNRTAR